MPLLDMVGITCKDIAASLRFYRLLGIEIEDPAPGDPYVEVAMHNGLRLSWNSEEMVKSLIDDWQAPVGQRMGLAFLCSAPLEVDEFYKKIVEAGYVGKKEPWDAFWGQRYAIVEDPDGNAVDLFAWNADRD